MRKAEMLTVGTIIVIFAIISSSGYQLPHYLNVLFPIFAVITAGVLVTKAEEKKESALRRMLYVQYFVMGAVLLLLILLNLWCFPVHSVLTAIIAIVVLAALIYSLVKKTIPFQKIVVISVLTAALTNILLNGNVYMQLLNNYQSGIGLAEVVNQNHIPKQDIYKFNIQNSSFNFHTQHLTANMNGIDTVKAAVASGKPLWLLTTGEGKTFLEKSGLKADIAYSYTNYGITRLTPKFLNPATRGQTLEKHWLVKVSPVLNPPQRGGL